MVALERRTEDGQGRNDELTLVPGVLAALSQVEAATDEKTAVTPSENPNIGALGSAGYQADNLRIKGFCGELVEDPDTYLHHLTQNVLPLTWRHPEATRVIDRAIIRADVRVPTEELSLPLRPEVVVPLGGRWQGYNWVMTGTHLPGRVLSHPTRTALVDLAEQAARHQYESPKALPPGYTMERLIPGQVSAADCQRLAEIFSQAFKTYISPLSTAAEVATWVNSDGIFPVVVRNEEGQIMAVANGDMGEITVGGQPFRFLEIGDSAADPSVHRLGLNRHIKHYIIQEAIRMGFDSIHTETRAAWGSPNFGNAKNGMWYRGTLFLNCKISGAEDVRETADPEIDEASRVMGSLNVWSMTPANLNWARYQEMEHHDPGTVA